MQRASRGMRQKECGVFRNVDGGGAYGMWAHVLREGDNGAGNGGGNAGGGAAGGGTTNAGNEQGQGGNTPPDFDTWYNGLDTAQKGLVDNHVTGLKTALQSERTERSNLARQISDLQKTAAKGSDLEKQLTDLQNTLALTERRAAFAEDAIKPEVGCTNVKAAYALALADDLFDRQGRPDWVRIKQAAPELFRRAGAGSADGGAGNGQPPKLDMNTIIRRAAGRG